jgi:hypothetical protein
MVIEAIEVVKFLVVVADWSMIFGLVGDYIFVKGIGCITTA